MLGLIESVDFAENFTVVFHFKDLGRQSKYWSGELQVAHSRAVAHSQASSPSNCDCRLDGDVPQADCAANEPHATRHQTCVLDTYHYSEKGEDPQ